MPAAPPPSPAAPPPPGTARAFAQQALTDRITTLESQITGCEDRAQRAEELRDKTLQKCRELGSELTQTKASLEEQLRDKDVQLEVVTLQMETLKNTKKRKKNPGERDDEQGFFFGVVLWWSLYSAREWRT